MATKTIKLHTALKLKNRFAGEINRLQQVIQRENARRSDNASKIDVGVVDATLKETRLKLRNLKGAIAAANVPIYPLLAELEETKAAIAFYQGLPNREGTEVVYTHTGNLEYTWASYLNREKIDALVIELQERVNNLQDEIDTFNAGASVVVDL